MARAGGGGDVLRDRCVTILPTEDFSVPVARGELFA
jgi:hypothetical protein